MEDLAGEGNRTLRLQEVMEASAACTDEVKAGRVAYREITRGDQKAAGRLHERSELFPMGKVPLEHYRVRTDSVGHAVVGAEGGVTVKRGIDGNDVESPLEITAHPSLADLGREHFADASAEHKEVELRGITAVSVGGEAGKKAKVPRPIAE